MNRTTEWSIFEFISSDPKLLDVNCFDFNHFDVINQMFKDHLKESWIEFAGENLD